MNLHAGHGHVDVGGKDRDEEQDEAPAGQKLDPARGNEQPRPAEQLENAADLNAGQMKRNPRRHDRKKELRLAQMDRPGEEEERGEKQADEEAENQGREDNTMGDLLRNASSKRSVILSLSHTHAAGSAAGSRNSGNNI